MFAKSRCFCLDQWLFSEGWMVIIYDMFFFM